MAARTESETETVREFHALVNMTPKALSTWLESDESREAGQKSSEGAESTGHRSGRRIVEILEKKRDEYDAGDVAHMRKVIGYIKRHSAQRPAHGDVAHTRWAASLKNWGHDPGK